MERSAIRDVERRFPDFVSLHPGYTKHIRRSGAHHLVRARNPYAAADVRRRVSVALRLQHRQSAQGLWIPGSRVKNARPGMTAVGEKTLSTYTSSLPDLTRQSIFSRKKMDARIKSGHDD